MARKVNKQSTRTYEVSYRCPQSHGVDCSLVKTYFVANGVSENDIVETVDDTSTCLSVFFSSREKARELVKKLSCSDLTHGEVRYRSYRTSEWQTKWKEQVKPVTLAGRFRVVPAVWENPYRGKKESICIDTDVAFGTGLHPTTQCVAEFLVTCEGRYKSFFDLGTGTGILALVAVRCGAEKVWGVDLCADAVATAESNFSRNGNRWDYLAVSDIRSLKKRGHCDFVAANILSQALVDERRKILSYVRAGKFLAVSGIADENYSWFRKNFDGPELVCIKTKRKSGWRAVLYQKKECV